MRVTVIGSGYVGLVTGACLSDLGFKVVCLDKDEEKIRALQEGDVPIYEPGLKELLTRNRADGRIRFTSDACEAIEHGDILFIAVGTPRPKMVRPTWGTFWLWRPPLDGT
jgi:UDPglucose 6-dehydrogenase